MTFVSGVIVFAAMLICRRWIPSWASAAMAQPLIPAGMYVLIAIAALSFREQPDAQLEASLPAQLPLRSLVVGLAPILSVVGGGVTVFGSIDLIRRLHFGPDLLAVVPPAERWTVSAVLAAVLYCVFAPALLECLQGLRAKRETRVQIVAHTTDAYLVKSGPQRLDTR